MLELTLLFFSAFIAATLLPVGSELALYAMLHRGFDPTILVLVATLGNTAGACVNWLLGKYLAQLQHKRWFYFRPEQVARAQLYFGRYGKWSLLLAWLPVVGDLLTLAAGILQVRLTVFVVLVGAGKLLRYLLIVQLVV